MGVASQVWACISGMGMHFRYRRASQEWALHLGYRRYISGIGVHRLAGPAVRSKGRGTVATARSIAILCSRNVVMRSLGRVLIMR